ncbi:MAG: hypothetical protein PHE24_00700 [Patescibacteria group bacterium]|nr:hypothetical protein [Patescibacteria group bacterium]
MIKVFSQILNYFPIFAVAAVFLWVIAAHWKKWNLWILVWVMIGFHLGLALIKSILQYWAWDQSQLTRLLLNLPVDKTVPGWLARLPIFADFSHGYFWYYIWNNFWKEALFSLIAAFIIYGIFRLLQRYKPRFFQSQDSELGLLMALLVGWPQIILFLPITFLVAMVFSLAKSIFRQETYCPLAWPFLISTALMLVFNAQLSVWLYLLLKII